ncbi:ABC transporter ATP-binding protein [Ornithinimicrobium faecis]|uniref:ABC transporter ATP-binding protein n=1 Tax=Ornithinimicrobium faecis TaxID=2934158 RepID=A0ABY4YXT3_9MICO|nr:ABC transporter ATP-binding protein [Ornithinimicrobium sp. HY1793]USQ81583.1 ABC transporter ATP-binding protein [Ornithinimicrobium sp. HY1793]
MSKSLSDSVLSGRGLVKTFGATRALDGLNLEVASGEIHGFLGPNGAGKSTTIRALLGQLRLNDGRAEVFGMDPWRHGVATRSRLAYVPGDTSLWPGLSGGECIDLLGGFQGTMDPRRRDDLVERFELDPTKRARTYSKGNRQKVALVAALSCDADLFILDEPTSGLDPLMESVFQQVVGDLNAEGRTVLLSSHILAEVEALCDRLTIIRSGRTVSTGTLEELRLGTLTTIDAITPAPPARLDTIEGVSNLTQEQRPHDVRTTLTVTHAGLTAAIAAVSAAGPRDLTVRPPSLEQLFLEHYQESDADHQVPNGGHQTRDGLVA